MDHTEELLAFCHRLKLRAGVPNGWHPDSVKDDEWQSRHRDFQTIMKTLAEIRAWKSQQYGDSRLTPILELPRYDEALIFSDLHRKYIRLREQTWGATEPNTIDRLETLGDLAVYAVMGLQIFAIIEEMKKP